MTNGSIRYKLVNGARPYANETSSLAIPAVNPKLNLVQEGNKIMRQFNAGPELKQAKTKPTGTAMLGKAKVRGFPMRTRMARHSRSTPTIMGRSVTKQVQQPVHSKTWNGSITLTRETRFCATGMQF